MAKGKLGQGRLASFRNAEALRNDQEAQGELLRELERCERQGHLAGEGEAERRAILDWQRGLQHVRCARLSEALAAYERAETALNQASPSLREHVGEALYALAGELLWPQGRRNAIYSAEAERILSRVVAYLPEKSGAWSRLGVAMGVANHYEDALAAFQQAQTLDPKHAVTWNGMGNVYRRLGRYDEALKAYQEAQRLDPKDAYAWHGMGNVYGNLGRYEEALAAYQEAQRLDPKDAGTWHSMGVVHHLLDQLEQALVAHQQALSLDLNNGSFRATLAGLLRVMGREAEAADELAQAQPPTEREDAYNRACFAALSGDHAAALALLREALVEAPGLRDWGRHDPDFASLRADPRFVALVE